MKIYTKTGDKLHTTTFKGKVLKSDFVIELEGSLDEATSFLALAMVNCKDLEVKNILEKIIKKLFEFGSDLLGYTKNKVILEDVSDLEKLIDFYSEKMVTNHEFIIPGQTIGGANIHVARTSVRRLERNVVKYALENEINENLLKYINRLSDLLFTLGKWEDR